MRMRRNSPHYRPNLNLTPIQQRLWLWRLALLCDVRTRRIEVQSRIPSIDPSFELHAMSSWFLTNRRFVHVIATGYPVVSVFLAYVIASVRYIEI
jgi:hypothetical protein